MRRALATYSVLLAMSCGVLAQESDADLPADFPRVMTHIYDCNAIGQGYVYLGVAVEADDIGYYAMVLDNQGGPIWCKRTSNSGVYDFKVQPNGLLTYADVLNHHAYDDGADAVHIVIDGQFDEIDSFQAGNGYTAEAHDFRWLPNGHALVLSHSLMPMDLSASVDGGASDVLVSSGVVQELDADRNVVFQWRIRDHLCLEDVNWAGASGPVPSPFPLTAMDLDTDGHILLATPSSAKKIDRRTGQIIWHLGGDDNEFTFIGVDPAEAVGHFGGHGVHRLDNGHVLIYDNGSLSQSRSSQVHEYRLDESQRIAEHVWSYVPSPPIYGWCGGNAQRLPNGNTFIGWGRDGAEHGPACTEVTPDGRKVFELFFDNPAVESYRAFRMPLPADIKGINVIKQFVGLGNHRFRNAQTDTGVTVTIDGYTGTGYNAMGVRRVPLAPLYPTFEGWAPIVLPVRVQVGASGMITIDGGISLDATCFALDDPNALIVYTRDPEEPGPFVALPTTYNPATNQVQAAITRFGEFIIGRPDLEHVALEPILIWPEHEGTVDETLPAVLDWTPQGLVTSYHLQIATDPEYQVLIVDEQALTETPYAFEPPEAKTTYYWRVNTANNAGVSPWSQASFTVEKADNDPIAGKSNPAHAVR